MATTTKRVGSAVDVNKFQIRTKKGLKQFLRAIHPGFLAYVDPRHSSLLDIMIQNDLLTDSDQESLSGKGVYVRRDQARKLWFSLHKMRVQDFTSTVLPELCSNFPHILPEEWMDSNEDGPDEECCFRHDIMDKIRPATMADLLFDCHCLSLEDYKDLSETNVNEEMIWEALFEAVRRKNTGETGQALRRLLNKRKVDVPNNFLDLLSSGIPCTCHRSEQRLLASITPATSEEKITKWLWMSHSKGGSTVHSDVCTTVDGLSVAERDTDSLFGSGEGSFFSQKPTRVKTPLSDDFQRIARIGKAGAGKSTTGNFILGENLRHTRHPFSLLIRNCEIMTTKRDGPKMKQSEGMHRLLCRRCGVPACTSQNIRLLKHTHRVVIGREFSNKYDRRDDDFSQKKENDPSLHITGKLYCRNCGLYWGIMVRSLYDGFEFPVICINSFIIKDSNSRLHLVDKWSQAFSVPEITDEDRQWHYEPLQNVEVFEREDDDAQDDPPNDLSSVESRSF